MGRNNRICICWALLAFITSSCAPLTRPELDNGPGGTAQSMVDTVLKINHLEEHLRLKHALDEMPHAQPRYVAVLPFADESGFRKGVWDLSWEMAKLLSGEAEAIDEWKVIPYAAVDEVLGRRRTLKMQDVLEVGRILEADVLFLGTIDNYDMKRLSVGDPLLGGYKSYVGAAALRVGALRMADQSDMGMVTTEREVSDRDLGLDLFGKPREQDVEFAELKNLEFGSEAFREALLGQATMLVMAEILSGLESLFQPDELNLDGSMAEVLSVYGDDIYINVGSENGLRAGYRFGVHPGIKRKDGASGLIGVIEVKEVIGARLSSVTVLEGAERIQAGDRLKSLEQEIEAP
ncbi:MAG: hypothetical protein ACKVJG_03885 [Candidatus Latescibacterota bacterium]